MILRRRNVHEDLKRLWVATKALELRKWHPERRWSEQIHADEVIPTLPHEKVRIEYTHAPISGRIPLLRRNAIKEYFQTMQFIIPDSLERLRTLKLPYVAHLDSSWELRAIRSILRRGELTDPDKARAIVRLAGSGLAKHKMGSERRIPYEVIMAHFSEPDAAAAYYPEERKIMFPSPSAVRQMMAGNHRRIPDLVNSFAHEFTHHVVHKAFDLHTEDEVLQILYDSMDEGAASGFGDLTAWKVAGGPRPKREFAEYYAAMHSAPLHRDLFVRTYEEVTRSVKTAEDLPEAVRTVAREFGVRLPTAKRG